MKRLALEQSMGNKQEEFIELAYGEGASASLLGKESLGNLVWRVNKAFEENWFFRFEYEQGADEPDYEILKTVPWLEQGKDGLYRVYKSKPPSDWWLTSVE